MISTTGSTCSASSDRTLSTTWSPSSAAIAAGCVSGSIERAGPRIASRTADQNRCASCWSRSTDTNATRRRSVERSAHARNSEVFPLPGGAEMTVTRLVTARSSSWRRSSRSSRPRATETSLEIGCSRSSLRCVVAKLVMRFSRSSPSIRLGGWPWLVRYRAPDRGSPRRAWRRVVACSRPWSGRRGRSWRSRAVGPRNHVGLRSGGRRLREWSLASPGLMLT